MLGWIFTHVVALYFNRKSESFPSLVFLHHFTVPRFGGYGRWIFVLFQNYYLKCRVKITCNPYIKIPQTNKQQQQINKNKITKTRQIIT